MVHLRQFFGVVVLVAAMLIGASLASAELSVTSDKDSYSLGDSISVDYSFSRDQDFSGLVKLSLICSDFSLEFYTLPTSMPAGQGQQVTVPLLAVSQSMLGRCYILANASSYDSSINEVTTSRYFNVTSVIGVSVTADKDIYLPSATVQVSGEAAKSQLLPASVMMTFLDSNYVIPLSNNSFAYSIKLPKDVRSGKHELDFTVNDTYGNSGFASLEFGVEAVPTRLVSSISAQSVRPGEGFTVSSVVYDQAGDRMQSEVAFVMNDSSGDVVLTASGSTSSDVPLAFPEGQAPGVYTLISSALGLTAYNPLVVEEVENVSVTFDNSRMVVLKNIGNVNYARKFNVTLLGKKSFAIVNDVKLAPGQSFEIDLSNSVPTGDYNIAFPTVPNSTIAENTHVNDERSGIKKVFDFLRVTSRNVQVIGTGTGKFQMILAPILLLVIVVALVFFFFRNRQKGQVPKLTAAQAQVSAPEAKKEQYKSVSHTDVENPEEEAKIRRIIDEKKRIELERTGGKPTNLRDDPSSKKFIKDMMKDKPMR